MTNEEQDTGRRQLTRNEEFFSITNAGNLHQVGYVSLISSDLAVFIFHVDALAVKIESPKKVSPASSDPKEFGRIAFGTFSGIKSILHQVPLRVPREQLQ